MKIKIKELEEEHKQKVKEYQLKTNYKSSYVPTPEQKKKWARRAYLKRKEKIQEIDENSNGGKKLDHRR